MKITPNIPFKYRQGDKVMWAGDKTSSSREIQECKITNNKPRYKLHLDHIGYRYAWAHEHRLRRPYQRRT